MQIKFGQIELISHDMKTKTVECRVVGLNDTRDFKDIQHNEISGLVMLRAGEDGKIQQNRAGCWVPMTKEWNFTQAIAHQISMFIRRMPENPLKETLRQAFMDTAIKGGEFNQMRVLRPLMPLANADGK